MNLNSATKKDRHLAMQKYFLCVDDDDDDDGGAIKRIFWGRGRKMVFVSTYLTFSIAFFPLYRIPHWTLNDDAVRMLGYCTPPARHRRYPTYRPLPGIKGIPHTVT